MQSPSPTTTELLVEIRQDTQRVLSYVRDLSNPNVSAAINILQKVLRDPLTKLPNRQAFSQRASELSTSNIPYVIGLLDLDHFKEINNTMGHAKGDELLVIVASAIESQLSSADIVARLGGDEFVAIYRNTPPESVSNLLTALMSALPPTATAAGFPAITASGGVSSDRNEPGDLKLRDADNAMYEAKAEAVSRLPASLAEGY